MDPFSLTEKATAPHSSILAWKIPWTEEPGRLQSMGSHRVGHDWATWLSLFTFMHWRRKWQPTPVFLPGESQGRGSLMGCRLWGRTESDATEATSAVAAAFFLKLPTHPDCHIALSRVSWEHGVWTTRKVRPSSTLYFGKKRRNDLRLPLPENWGLEHANPSG